jgi:alkylation response protein AidB-like acyl-CoA dehydrogenase
MALPFGIYTLAMELAGAADAATAMSMAIHNTVAEGISRFGSPSQKESVFADLISGRRLAAFSLTEPSSGSDARSMSTRAVRLGSDYLINGSKMFITNAGEADVYLVFARSEKGYSAFLVDRSTPGMTVGGEIPKLGMRGSRTAEVRFEDCRVPAESLLGEDGKAFEYAKTMLNGSRIIMGSICVGIARTAYGKALTYSAQRELFEQRLADLQMTREKVANMRTEITSGRLLCLYASRLRELGLGYASEAAQAKILSTEMAARVCDQVIQIFGGYGYTDSDVHRHWRDARLLSIGEGASEVLRMLIAGIEAAGSG